MTSIASGAVCRFSSADDQHTVCHPHPVISVATAFELQSTSALTCQNPVLQMHALVVADAARQHITHFVQQSVE